MQYRGFILGLIFTFMLLMSTEAQALIMINEILADPPAGIQGDANNDGVGSISQDEFIELFNAGENAVNVGGWTLEDALRMRHTFAVSTLLLPQEIVVIFSGGSPHLPGINWLTVSSGLLGLNNGGDTVTLRDQDAGIIDQVVYGSEAGNNQSVVRDPEGSGDDFIQHLSLPNAGGQRFSPGFFVNTPTDTSTNTSHSVPEPMSIYCLGAGTAFMFFRRKGKGTVLG